MLPYVETRKGKETQRAAGSAGHEGERGHQSESRRTGEGWAGAARGTLRGARERETTVKSPRASGRVGHGADAGPGAGHAPPRGPAPRAAPPPCSRRAARQAPRPRNTVGDRIFCSAPSQSNIQLLLGDTAPQVHRQPFCERLNASQFAEVRKVLLSGAVLVDGLEVVPELGDAGLLRRVHEGRAPRGAGGGRRPRQFLVVLHRGVGTVRLGDLAILPGNAIPGTTAVTPARFCLRTCRTSPTRREAQVVQMTARPLSLASRGPREAGPAVPRAVQAAPPPPTPTPSSPPSEWVALRAPAAERAARRTRRRRRCACCEIASRGGRGHAVPGSRHGDQCGIWARCGLTVRLPRSAVRAGQEEARESRGRGGQAGGGGQEAQVGCGEARAAAHGAAEAGGGGAEAERRGGAAEGGAHCC